MNGAQPDLNMIQRWMQAVLMHPKGVAEGVDSDDARRFLEISPKEVENVLTASRALTAMERLAIYGSAYYARLLECLREEYPVLKHALGEEAFDAFAFGYLQKYPSRSYTLAKLGSEFSRYLAETCPEDERGAWPEFLIDLATLELNFNEVFDGPGVEGEQLLGAAPLLAIPAEEWPASRLTPVVCLRLLALRSPVHHYFSAVRRQEEPAPPEPAETLLAITRRDYVVRHYELARPAYELLRDLIAGKTIGEAVARAAERARADVPQLATQLQEWFRDWTAEGFFQGVQSAVANASP
jgi:hypothetical protein